jgi:anti-anti-sigma factor
MLPEEDEVFLKVAVANKLFGEEEGQLLLLKLAKRRLETSNPELTIEDFMVLMGKLSPAQAGAVGEAVRYNLQRVEDKQCAKLLLQEGKVNEGYVHRFLDEQQRLFKAERKIVSALDLMVKSCIVPRERVEKARARLRGQAEFGEDLPTGYFKPIVETPAELTHGNLTVRRRTERVLARSVVIVEAEGELDACTQGAFDEMMRAAVIEAGASHPFVIVDFRRLRYMSSSGIGVLNAWNSQLRGSRGALRLVGVRQEVRDVLALAGLTHSSYPDVEEAVASVTQ